MAALGGWVAYGLDVRNTYLYGELNEEIYMEQPKAWNSPKGSENQAKTLYADYSVHSTD